MGQKKLYAKPSLRRRQRLTDVAEGRPPIVTVRRAVVGKLT